MFIPKIDVNSRLGKLVARTLKMSSRQLDMSDGKRDGKFDIGEVRNVFKGQSSKIVALRKHIITPLNRLVKPMCRGISTAGASVYFIDNGDGRIGRGDLFLYAGWTPGKGVSFRFAPLFKRRNVKRRLSTPRSDIFTPKADKIAKAVEAIKGKSWNGAKLKRALWKTCGCV